MLTDAAQAVIRLSKQYLPGMAAGFNHPNVKVHVGDGFKFLDDYKNTFDVIITDSSDPDGPAESLFEKPYFQLLFDALRAGGVITTQGCMFSFSAFGFVRSAPRGNQLVSGAILLGFASSVMGGRFGLTGHAARPWPPWTGFERLDCDRRFFAGRTAELTIVLHM